MTVYHQMSECRICDSPRLDVLLDLGTQFLTGVFPRTADTSLTKGPLTLVRCSDCGLVQLLHSYDRNELYGSHYGYRSSLNRMMVKHLQAKAQGLVAAVDLRPGDVVLDIGSNDGTLLSFFAGRSLHLVGVDPSAARWRGGYPPGSELIADFFSADSYRSVVGRRQARIITSIAMFYDLERPLDFVREVAGILAPDGIWHLEQSYLPTMLEMNAYDTICHEHVEYYALSQIEWLATKVGLTVVDVERNQVNGGSFAVTLGWPQGAGRARSNRVDLLLEIERQVGLDSDRPYRAFRSRVMAHRRVFRERLEELSAKGALVLGYGASTKGNVLLQFAGIGRDLLPAIAEVNEDKIGCVTPGTWIPIISDAEARQRKPDCFLVLPWHFRDSIVHREAAYLAQGGQLLFPLPSLDVVPASSR